MPTDDPTRLRDALDQIANALQPAVIVAAQLQRASAATAQDAAVVEVALTRVVAILKAVQRDRPEWKLGVSRIFRQYLGHSFSGQQRGASVIVGGVAAGVSTPFPATSSAQSRTQR